MLWVPILLRFAPYILGALALAGGWYGVNYRWCNAACEKQVALVEEVRGELAGITSRLEAAQKRATDLALLWSEALNKVEVRYVERQQRQAVTFASVRERTGRIRVDLDAVKIRVPAAALGVLADANSAANGGAPQAAAVDSGAPAAVPGATGNDADTTLTEWVQFATDAAAAYADADSKRQAAVDAALACHTYVGKITQKEPDHE